MIHEVECYSVTCDNCKEPFVEECTCFSIWNDKNIAHESATNSGWIDEDDKLYCPDCCEYDDDDKLIFKT
jgi:hypothetical protein